MQDRETNLISFYELARVSESGIGKSSRGARPAGIGERKVFWENAEFELTGILIHNIPLDGHDASETSLHLLLIQAVDYYIKEEEACF